MKPSKTLFQLAILIAVLAAAAAAAGLFWPGGPGLSTFTSVHGQPVEIYGRGIYSSDSLFFAGAFIGTDAVTLFLAIPLLLAAAVLYRRGLLKGLFFLAGMLSYFLYYGASMALGVAYNSFFIVYLALFTASLFAFVLAFRAFDLKILPDRIGAEMPHRGITIFMYASGVVLLGVWFSDVLSALLQNHVPPLLGPYTTMVTYVLDLGIITPAVLVTGRLVQRRAPEGYPLAGVMLILCVLIGLVIIGQTVAQIQVGVDVSTGQAVGIISAFIILAAAASILAARFFRGLRETSNKK